MRRGGSFDQRGFLCEEALNLRFGHFLRCADENGAVRPDLCGKGAPCAADDLIFVKWQRDDLLIKLNEAREELKGVKLNIGKLEYASESVNNLIRTQIHDTIL